MRFAFKVEGHILPWQRSRVDGRSKAGKGHHFISKEQAAYRAQIVLFAKQAMIKARWPALMEGPIELTVAAFYTPPKKALNLFWKATRPDLDNIIKQVKDSLNQVAYKDDGQVSQYGPNTGKFYADREFLFVQLATLDQEPFNVRKLYQELIHV